MGLELVIDDCVTKPFNSRELLALSRWHDTAVRDRSIGVQVLRLRRKIDQDPATPYFIRTERGVGYIFQAQVEALI